MKKLLLLSLISFAFSTTFAAARSDVDTLDSKSTMSKVTKSVSSNKNVERYTANYFKQAGKAEQFNGKRVTLYITESKISSSDKEGYQKFTCTTYYNNKQGGTATVYVPNSKAQLFYKIYKDVQPTASYSNSNKKNNKNKNVIAIRPQLATLHTEGGLHFITD